MIIKELIYAEIDRIQKEDLDELYEVFRHFARVKAT